MKKSFRRGAALLLTFMMLLGMVCMPVSAADVSTDNAMTLASDDYTVEMFKSDGSTMPGGYVTSTWSASNTGGKNSYPPEVVDVPSGLNSTHKKAIRLQGDSPGATGATDTAVFISTNFKQNDTINQGNTPLNEMQRVPLQNIKLSLDLYIDEGMKAQIQICTYNTTGTNGSARTFSHSVTFNTDGTYTVTGSGQKKDYPQSEWFTVDIYLNYIAGTWTVSMSNGMVTTADHLNGDGQIYQWYLCSRVNTQAEYSGKNVYIGRWEEHKLTDLKSTDVASEEVVTGFPVIGGEVGYNFSHDMAATGTATFESEGHDTVSGTIRADGKKIYVSPENALDFNTEYTVKVAKATDKYGRTTAVENNVKIKTPENAGLYSGKVTSTTTGTLGSDYTISASTTAVNPDVTDQSAAVIAAGYNADKQLVLSSIQKETVAKESDSKPVSLESNSNVAEMKEIYVYAVDGETLSKPLFPSILKITSEGKEEIFDCTPTTVSDELTFAVSTKGEITVSGTATPKTWVYINVEGPVSSGSTTMESKALVPVQADVNGKFERVFTPSLVVSGDYKVSVGGWQSATVTKTASCIDEDTANTILSLTNTATDAGDLETKLEPYKTLLSKDASVFTSNGYQTVLEQRTYTDWTEITQVFDKAKSALAKVNAASADELAAVMEADADIILYGVTFLDDFKALSTENKARICGFMSDDETYNNFAELRTELDWAWSHHLDIKNGVNNAQTADAIKTVLEANKTLLGEDDSLFCDNAYQTLLEQKGYKGVADIVAMMKTAKSLLEEVNSTNYAKLAPVLTDAEKKKILFFGHAALDTFANSDEDIRTAICSYMVPDMPFDSFTALRTSLTNAMKKYNDEQANIKNELEGNQTGIVNQGSRPSVSGGSKGSVSGVLSVGGATTTPTTPTPSATPTPSTTVETPFADMKDAAWASEHVASLAEKGIISGDADGNFRPNDAVTREEFVKLLVGALGIEVGDAAESFADADIDAWYAKYLAAAKAAGIITGNEDGTFGIGNEITRQDMAVMAVRAVNAIGKTLPSGGATFTDSDSISSYAAQAVGQMQEAGILNGIGNGTFAPMDSTSRAAAAKVIDSLMNLVIGK